MLSNTCKPLLNKYRDHEGHSATFKSNPSNRSHAIVHLQNRDCRNREFLVQWTESFAQAQINNSVALSAKAANRVTGGFEL